MTTLVRQHLAADKKRATHTGRAAITLAIIITAVLGIAKVEMNMMFAKAISARQTCLVQTSSTVPTFSQCMDNQFEQNGDK